MPSASSLFPAASFAIIAASISILSGCQTAPPEDSKPAATMSGSMPMAPATAPAPMAKVSVPLSPLVDSVMPGDDAAEKAHNQQGENTDTGDWTDRTYRDSPDGWFSWDLKVDPNVPNELLVTYAGVDKRTFQILIDGKPFSSRVQPGSTDDFYDQKYPLSPDITKGKQKITVRFQSINGGYAGGVFGVKVMRAAAAK